MNEVERLRKWMDETGHTMPSLAKAINLSYDGVYQALNVRGVTGRVSNGFKWRFTQAFGLETAQSIFADHDESMRPFTTLSPEAELVTK